MYHGGDRTRYYRQSDRAEHRTHKQGHGGRVDKSAGGSKEHGEHGADRSAADKVAELAAQISSQIQKDGIFDVAVQTIVDTALQQPACTALSDKLKKDLAHSIWHQLDSGMVLPTRKGQIRVASLKRVLHDPMAERFNTSTLYQIVSGNCDWHAVMAQAGVTARVQQLVRQLVPDDCARTGDCAATAPCVIDVSSDGPSADTVPLPADGARVQVDKALVPHEAVEHGEQAMDLDSATPPDVASHIEQAHEDAASASCPNVAAFDTSADGGSEPVCPQAVVADGDSSNVIIEPASTLVVCEEPASPDSDQSSHSSNYASAEDEQQAAAPAADTMHCAQEERETTLEQVQPQTPCHADVQRADEGAVSLCNRATPEATAPDLPAVCDNAEEALDECNSELVAHLGGNGAPLQADTSTETVIPTCEPLEQCEQLGRAAMDEYHSGSRNVEADAEPSQQVAAGATDGELQLEPVSDDEPYPIPTVDSPRQREDDGRPRRSLAAAGATGRRADDTVGGRRSSSGRRKRTRSRSRSRTTSNRRTSRSSHSRSDRPRRDRRKSRAHGDYLYY